MKNILGLDLGPNSIGWAFVQEAESPAEQSSIRGLGVRVNPLSTDELRNFEMGKSITTNADRRLKRSMRRNLQRYKLRREALLEILTENGWINKETVRYESTPRSTFETWRLRAKAATGPVSLEEFARVLLQLNKKRGYKSSRKIKGTEEGQLIDGMEVARLLYQEGLTPGQYLYRLLRERKKAMPDFYRSDLQAEWNRIWDFQQRYHPDILTAAFREEVSGKKKRETEAAFRKAYGVDPAENRGDEKRLQAARWRSEGLERRLAPEELVSVLADLNSAIADSSGYLGAIGDRSKELFFNRQTVGEYLMALLEKDPHTSLKKRVFYRQDYLDEFDRLWETQRQYHPELTDVLKTEIRDVVIFYQRKLKSQKGLVAFCEFESRSIEVEIDGKRCTRTAGSRVIPRSAPLFQEFKIWQQLNNLRVSDPETGSERSLEPEEKESLAAELNLKEKLTKKDALQLLFGKRAKVYDLNYDELDGNKTQAALVKACLQIVASTGHGEYAAGRMNAAGIRDVIVSVFGALGYAADLLNFDPLLEAEALEQTRLYEWWHLLYAFEGDDSLTGDARLVERIMQRYGFGREAAALLARVSLPSDYGSLSAKAIRKILPFLKGGNTYDVACAYAGYRHSAASLTREERAGRPSQGPLALIPKNSLRNPVVEKILNQMIHVVNQVSAAYGRPDEIRIELARELKKSAGEREKMTQDLQKSAQAHERIRNILHEEFGLAHVSRNDIVRYKLYEELAPLEYHTLYSGTRIPREKLFSKAFDIEHIIPQARLFDDSFSNKTLECRAVNLEKADATACDYVSGKGGESGLNAYLERVHTLYRDKRISKAKHDKLCMPGAKIPTDFLARDLCETRYITRKAKQLLESFAGKVTTTTGAVTGRLRDDWQLVDLMQELNWNKYDRLGLTETIENRDGQRIRRIREWTKRNDHRHHAMDALAIAFTKESFVQYLNNLNARSDMSSEAYAIQARELYRDEKGKMRFRPPMPLPDFWAEARKHLESVLVSIKAKNKVVTQNVNKTRKADGFNKRIQLTPRGPLHNETLYGSIRQPVVKRCRVGSGFDEIRIAQVSRKAYREALLQRLQNFGGDPKRAFTGKNSLANNPLYLDDAHTRTVPEQVDLVTMQTVYTIRKPVSPDLKIEKVIDPVVRKLLEERLERFDGNARQAFSNLEEDPIWLNREKKIAVKRVTITGIVNAVPLHCKRDRNGKPLLSSDGKEQPVDFVSTGNNHHVAVYSDAAGVFQERVVSFFEATERARQGIPLIDKGYRSDEGWQFRFSLKQNEYFIFPDVGSGFDPAEIDCTDPDNYARISPHLYRVQKIATRNYYFRHHLETDVEERKALYGQAYKMICTPAGLAGIVKIRIDHVGRIVQVGE